MEGWLISEEEQAEIIQGVKEMTENEVSFEIENRLASIDGKIDIDESIGDRELLCYLRMIWADQKQKKDILSEITIKYDPKTDSMALDYKLQPPRFQRIRRITGYLVGTLDRFNNAKKSEEHDRVKHKMQGKDFAR